MHHRRTREQRSVAVCRFLSSSGCKRMWPQGGACDAVRDRGSQSTSRTSSVACHALPWVAVPGGGWSSRWFLSRKMPRVTLAAFCRPAVETLLTYILTLIYWPPLSQLNHHQPPQSCPTANLSLHPPFYRVFQALLWPERRDNSCGTHGTQRTAKTIAPLRSVRGRLRQGRKAQTS